MNAILCPVDFTDTTRHTLEYATVLAKSWSVPMYIINVPQYPLLVGDNPMPLSVLKETEIDSLNNLQATQKQLTALYNYDNIKTSLEYGGITDAVDTKAHTINASLIIVNGAGANPDEQFTWEGMTDSIIHHTAYPILCVPAAAPMNPPARIVFATDFNKDDMSCFEHLMSLAGACNAYIEIVHVKHNDDAAVDAFKQRIESLEAVAKVTFQELEGINIENTLEEYTLSMPGSWLAVNRRYHTIFTRLFDRSLSNRLLHQTNIPVLIYNKHTK